MIAGLAARQHAVVSRAQLVAIGLSRQAIGRRLDIGRLHEVHRGVYAVGQPRLTMRGRWMAAVLAAGPHAVLSHRAAAALWGIREGTTVEVTAPTQRRSRNGLRIHRAEIPADERTTLDGIPTTTVPRTLLDLAAVVPKRQLERAINEAEYRRLADPLSIADLLARYPRRRGTRALRAIAIRPEITRSELEERFLAFLDAHGLPRPLLNHYVLGYECDCVWPDQRLIVELDSRAAHDTTHAFEGDRARDRALIAHGWRTVRVTSRQLQRDAASHDADLRALIQS